ncbi:hypothetical protein Psi02_74160 [Planotetraspora silvatica]|uniref:Antibiotic acetyltransferase n=1 Tax=Planotetraspora silvatica TaxID=234614 RepID=A0A8J3XQL4_9ACTN|nr:hypothetical protein [Planotetraspora silvatica]GII50992.1 hypothetical protein Psi02_74160 [Planotetraspora silvatica]
MPSAVECGPTPLPASLLQAHALGKYCAIASGTRFLVPPYAIVGGNPATVIRKRFADADVDRLLRAAWWDWPVDLVTEHLRTIMAGTPAEIERIAATRKVVE